MSGGDKLVEGNRLSVCRPSGEVSAGRDPHCSHTGSRLVSAKPTNASLWLQHNHCRTVALLKTESKRN